ncbi:MAG: radical SAM protein [Methanospirillaceae archaeon]|nr:radical SAM protein [Methanospirillaceae archaeon]
MRVIQKIGRDDIAVVYVAERNDNSLIEFVESVQPPVPREEKWVLIISSLSGCPAGCRFCDAGGTYQGVLSYDELLFQIDTMVSNRYPDRTIPVHKFKIQFARMGEPSFNPHVLPVLKKLKERYEAPGLIVSFSTIAPQGREKFFEELLKIKNNLFPEAFQLQFSLHTTDDKVRDWLIPIKKWDFQQISDYGRSFYRAGDRKITLNFALAEGIPVKTSVLIRYFPTDIFLIKVTPVNPTYRARESNIVSSIKKDGKIPGIIQDMRNAGYEVIVSTGEGEENYIGSNCGQYVIRAQQEKIHLPDAYTYQDQGNHAGFQ